jgi:sulfite reductase (NADPH) flavoprotein alpha-component
MPNPVPQSAPFTPAQKAWLDGFLAGALNLQPAHGVATAAQQAAAQVTALATQNGASANTASAIVASTPLPTAPASAVPTPPTPRVEEVEKDVVPAYDRVHPFPATVLETRPLNRKDSEKDVRAVRLSLKGSGLTYEVGDALGVYPENDPDLVKEILAVLEATGEEPVITPEGMVVPARIALSKAYVITEVNEDLLMHLSHVAADPEETSRLAILADDDPEGFLDGRDVLDILHHFPSTAPTSRADIAELIASLSPLRSRLYSIASSLKAHPDEVHLTIGVVQYTRDGCNRLRKGVASTFLTERMKPGHRVGVFIHPAHSFALPENTDTPIIMVGPGTGIAPFRAFLQERQAVGARGKNWLFFGDQRRECDFLYQSELEEYVNSGLLTHLDLAFSRDQQEKIYVQNRMMENAAELWGWLEEGAHFYVCGDAKRMASDVDRMLQRIIAEQGKISAEEAKAYVARLSRTGRYQRDVY